MISWESVFSLLFASVLLGFIILTFNAYGVDTVLYEYQLANDFAEVVYKTNTPVGNNDEFKNTLNELKKDSGYCICAAWDGSEEIIHSTCGVLVSHQCSDYFHDSKSSVTVVTRRVSGLEFKKVKYYVWKSNV
ncbi:hypothetical protein KO465_02330 [Candidatus Micrarchaeota archaeon]|nr:hypothetical protein [Candidatus Micrarchaeota archaeon]